MASTRVVKWIAFVLLLDVVAVYAIASLSDTRIHQRIPGRGSR
jgi:hypothetical protein